MPAQLLRRHPRAGDAEGDPGQEAGVVADPRGGEDGSDLVLVDAAATAAAPLAVGEGKIDLSAAGFAKGAVAAAGGGGCGDGGIVGEVGGEAAAQAGGAGDEVDDAADAGHVAAFAGEDLRVQGGDDGGLGVVAAGEVGEDAEAGDDAAGVEFDGAGVVPLLQFADGVGAGDASGAGGRVDVNARPFLGGLACLFEGLGDGRGVGGTGVEGGGFDVFVLGVLWCDCPDKLKAKFELGVQEIQGIFLGGSVRGFFFFNCIRVGRLTRISHSLDSSLRFRSMTSPTLAYRLISKNSPTNPLTLLKLGTSALDHSSMILMSSAQRYIMQTLSRPSRPARPISWL